MPDLYKDFHARDADAHLSSGEQEAVLMFLCPEGWVGVTLNRDNLRLLQDRISRELARESGPNQRQ